MLRFGRAALLATALSVAPGISGAKGETPIRFTHVVEAGGRNVPVASELYMTALSDTVIAVKVAGNLGALQAALPSMFSSVLENTCKRRVGLEVQQVRAEGDQVRLHGRIQILAYRCRDPEDFSTRQRLFSTTSGFDALFDGQIVENCLEASLEELTLEPGGFGSRILNVSGLTRRIAARAREGVNAAIEEKLACLDLPEEFRIIDTRLRSGGFRDFGGGEMGFVVKGTVDVRAGNVIALISALARNGQLRD
ncbi:MAG: hypothetical protein KDK03_11880 [Rhodobacteraceae bacterium]|nr:hypothetical protein [Paracoccaceae bacterium]